MASKVGQGASGGGTRQEKLVGGGGGGGGGGGKRGAGERRGEERKGGKISLEDAIQVEVAKEQEERERRQLILENKQRAWLKQQARKRRLAKEAEADAKRDSALEGGAAVAE